MFILIITIGIIGTIIGNRSKYVEKEEDIHQINTSDFYFESNYLSEEEKEYDYNDWNGQNKYDIEVQKGSLEENLYVKVKTLSKSDGKNYSETDSTIAINQKIQANTSGNYESSLIFDRFMENRNI